MLRVVVVLIILGVLASTVWPSDGLSPDSRCSTWTSASSAQHQTYVDKYGGNLIDIDVRCDGNPRAHVGY